MRFFWTEAEEIIHSSSSFKVRRDHIVACETIGHVLGCLDLGLDMQTFRACARARPTRLFLPTARGFSSAPNNPPVLPWFLEEEPVPHSFVARPNPPHLRPKPDRPPVPENAPQPLKQLHAELSESPHLEQSTLVVSQPLAPPMGPALPLRMPQGRRRRGGTFAGVSSYDYPGGIWNWVIMAQVGHDVETSHKVLIFSARLRKVPKTEEP